MPPGNLTEAFFSIEVPSSKIIFAYDKLTKSKEAIESEQTSRMKRWNASILANHGALEKEEEYFWAMSYLLIAPLCSYHAAQSITCHPLSWTLSKHSCTVLCMNWSSVVRRLWNQGKQSFLGEEPKQLSLS